MKYAVWTGLALGSIGLAQATTIVTFQLDMTRQIADAAFVPGVNSVYVRGDLNGWGTTLLTNNPAAANTNLYTATLTNTTDAAGALMNYKFCIDSGGWESGNNRQVGLPTTEGASFLVPACYFNDSARTDTTVNNNITFQVDMTQQTALGYFIPGSSTVSVRGGFNSWGLTPMTNDPSGANTNLYSMTVSQIDAPINLEHFKFYIDTGSSWENPSTPSLQGRAGDLNRYYNMLAADGDIVLPPVYFNDLPPAPPITNTVTFQVDMSIQVAIGHFNPSDSVECRGTFTSWGSNPLVLTNDPNAPNTNLYTGTMSIITPPTGIEYKFYSSDPLAGNSGWESPTSTGGGNRSYTLSNTTATITIPSVFFNDLASTANFLTEDTYVTFTVNMTNAITTGGLPFGSGDSVYLNGDWIPWWTWDDPLQSFLPYQLTNHAEPLGNQLYSIELLIPKGNSLMLTYKYSINGSDNELPANTNHIRYVRHLGAYAMAMDKFGTRITEPNFGQLAIGTPAAGKAPVSWLGLPGVKLQSSTNLSGSWQTLAETDGGTWANGYMSTNGFVSATNYPTTAPQTFFRLIQQ